jgi:hypothetical protein
MLVCTRVLRCDRQAFRVDAAFLKLLDCLFCLFLRPVNRYNWFHAVHIFAGVIKWAIRIQECERNDTTLASEGWHTKVRALAPLRSCDEKPAL